MKCYMTCNRYEMHPISNDNEANLHFTSKGHFMFMLKMCIRRLDAAVTKSIAGGSS